MVSYDSPQLVASLAGNAGAFATQEAQQQMSMRQQEMDLRRQTADQQAQYRDAQIQQMQDRSQQGYDRNDIAQQRAQWQHDYQQELTRTGDQRLAQDFANKQTQNQLRQQEINNRLDLGRDRLDQQNGQFNQRYEQQNDHFDRRYDQRDTQFDRRFDQQNDHFDQRFSQRNDQFNQQQQQQQQQRQQQEELQYALNNWRMAQQEYNKALQMEGAGNAPPGTAARAKAHADQWQEMYHQRVGMSGQAPPQQAPQQAPVQYPPQGTISGRDADGNPIMSAPQQAPMMREDQTILQTPVDMGGGQSSPQSGGQPQSTNIDPVEMFRQALPLVGGDPYAAAQLAAKRHWDLMQSAA